MKKLMMTLALVSATACTTVNSNPTPVATKEPVAEKNSEQNLREARQAALLEALGAK